MTSEDCRLRSKELHEKLERKAHNDLLNALVKPIYVEEAKLPDGTYAPELSFNSDMTEPTLMDSEFLAPDSSQFLLEAMGVDIQGLEKKYSKGFVGKAVYQQFINFYERGDFSYHGDHEAYFDHFWLLHNALYQSLFRQPYRQLYNYRLDPSGAATKEDVALVQKHVSQLMLDTEQQPDFWREW